MSDTYLIEVHTATFVEGDCADAMGFCDGLAKLVRDLLGADATVIGAMSGAGEKDTQVSLNTVLKLLRDEALPFTDNTVAQMWWSSAADFLEARLKPVEKKLGDET